MKLTKEIKEIYGETKEKDYEAEVEKIVVNLKDAFRRGADKNAVVKGLAGVGTPESMAMRRELIEQGAEEDYIDYNYIEHYYYIDYRDYIDYIAHSLAGANTREAEEFREKYFNHPTLLARSYSTDWSPYDAVICRYGYEK